MEPMRPNEVKAAYHGAKVGTGGETGDRSSADGAAEWVLNEARDEPGSEPTEMRKRLLRRVTVRLPGRASDR